MMTVGEGLNTYCTALGSTLIVKQLDNSQKQVSKERLYALSL